LPEVDVELFFVGDEEKDVFVWLLEGDSNIDIRSEIFSFWLVLLVLLLAMVSVFLFQY
jgi:hypothetical protein